MLVTLDFTAPERASYVAIDDPLPAIFEAVNPEFKSQAMAGRELSTCVWRRTSRNCATTARSSSANYVWPGETPDPLSRPRARRRHRDRAADEDRGDVSPGRFGLSASLVVKGSALK